MATTLLPLTLRSQTALFPPRARCLLGLACALVVVASTSCGRRSTSEAPIRQAAISSTWAPGTAYAVGNLATYNGVTYRCRQAHTSQVGWEPPKVPSLWERPGAAGINPWANQTAYVIGSGVSYNGLIYRCIQAHNSQPDWTPPAAPTLWKVTGNVQIPPGVSGSLAFVFKTKNLPSGITDGFGLIQRDPFGDATYTELLDSSKRSVNEVVHRIRVQGGEIFELYLQANKTNATSSPTMSPATYSSDPTMNMGVDPTYPDHVAQPLQTPAQKAANIWSIRWESFKFGDPGRDGNFNDLTVELRVEAPCNNSMIICNDPNLVVSSHSSTISDYRGDFLVPVAAPVPGVPAGPVKDPAGGEGSPMPLGSIVPVGGRVDTLRWSFVQEATDFSAATPPETAACPQCTPPGAPLLGGGLWSLNIQRIHRPRAEAFVSSFGPAVFSNLDAKLILQPNGLGNQNTVTLFDPESDAPPVTFFELSQQDGDNSVDGRYRDTNTRMFTSLTLYNSSGGVEPNIQSAKTAIAIRQTGEQHKFEIINVLGGTATQRQARLTAVLDRNGNGATVTYQFAASSSDSQLGGDRKKLWLMNRVTDPHGVFATFTYQLRAGTSRWVVSSIALPDATTLQYQYGTDSANLDRLTRVTYANGDTSDFSRAWDAPTQSWALTFKDAAGDDARAWKTVYVTGSTYTTADSVVHTQEPNLVRRIVNNDSEQVYKAMEDPNDPSTTLFREGANKITRLQVDATGLPRQTARATTIAADPLLASYAVVESYSGDVLGMVHQAVDGLGNARTFGRDSKTRAITSVTARGGSTASFTLNGFLQPTQAIDRIGRKTTVSYDSKGNPLAITHAVGTAVQAVWSYLYNSKGQVTKVTDANGKVTDYAYNATNFLISITEPPDVTGGTRAVRTFEYTPAGRLSAAVDASGRRVTFAYDNRGRLTTTSFPDNSSETLTYGSGTTAGLVVSRTNRRGIVDQYQYDSSRRLVGVISAAGLPEQLATTVTYASGTQQPSTQVAAGERVELTYDERHRPSSRTVFTRHAASLTTQKSWDDLDRDVSDTDPYGRRTLRVYDVNGRVVRTVRELVPGGVPSGSNLIALARVTTGNPPYVIEDTAYDAMNQATSTTDGRGFVTTRAFDSQGRQTVLIQVAGAAEERKTTYEYDLAGNVTKQTDPRTFTEGQTFQTLFTYTGRNLLKTRTEAAASADTATTSYTYTLTGKVQTVTDARGGVTSYAYDTCCDRVSSETDPAGFTTTFGYDAVGNRTAVTNPLGATTTFTYDGHNRLKSETNPLEHATQYTYDDDLTDGLGLDETYGEYFEGLGFGANANGYATRTTNPAGESTVEARDGAGRTVMAITPSGNATSTAYDIVVAGLLETAVTDPLDQVVRVRADGAGRVRISVDAAAKSSTRSFDPAGNLLSSRDPNNVGRDCTYDGLSQSRSCTDTQGDTNVMTYDASGNQVATTDGEGIQTSCTFDFRNRRKSCTDGVGGITRWAYDANSNLTSLTDAEGGVTAYTYDSRNLQLTETFPDSTGPADRVSKTYDGVRRLATRTDQGGNTITYNYDTANRLTQKTAPDGKVDTFVYDAATRLVSGTSQRYETTVTRTYDSGGRLATEGLIPAPGGATYNVGYSYDPADRLTTLQYPDGSTVTRTYTSRDQVASITRGAQSIAQYAYDDGGRLTSTTLGNGLVETRTYRNDDTTSSISTPAVGDLSYSYDRKKQKLTEGGTATNGPQTFSYDDEGRVTNWTGGASSQSWTLSLVGDWQSTTRNSTTETRTHNPAHEVTGVGAAPLTHDSRGNITQDDHANTLSWDLENRLSTHTAAEGAIVSYAYDVLGRKVGRTAGAVTTVFVHAGDEVVAEYENAVLRFDYVLGPKVDQPVAYVSQSAAFWYFANHLGTIAAVTDASGSVAERYRYDAFGSRSVLSPTGATRMASTVGNQMGFTGRYHDDAANVVDFRARHYSSRLGRFISRDDEYRDGMSRYGAYFVPNYVDPDGHALLRDIPGVLAGWLAHIPRPHRPTTIHYTPGLGQPVRLPPTEPVVTDPPPDGGGQGTSRPPGPSVLDDLFVGPAAFTPVAFRVGPLVPPRLRPLPRTAPRTVPGTQPQPRPAPGTGSPPIGPGGGGRDGYGSNEERRRCEEAASSAKTWTEYCKTLIPSMQRRCFELATDRSGRGGKEMSEQERKNQCFWWWDEEPLMAYAIPASGNAGDGRVSEVTPESVTEQVADSEAPFSSGEFHGTWNRCSMACHGCYLRTAPWTPAQSTRAVPELDCERRIPS